MTFILLGIGHLTMTLTFLGSTFTHSLEMIWSKYSTSLHENLHSDILV
jgi:hypothetical protein